MKTKHYLSLMIIATIATSLAIMSAPVMSTKGGPVIFDLAAYQYSTSGIIPGAAPGSGVLVDVYVDASALTNNSPEGMRAWGLTVTFDTNVLEPYYYLGTPYFAAGGSAGYFLYDWSYANWPPPPFPPEMPYPPTFQKSNGTVAGTDLGWILVAEAFLSLPPDMGAGGVGKLCSLYFKSKSLTAYTEITVEGWPDSGFTDATNTKYEIVGVDGHYNQPPDSVFLEQYAGSTWPPGDPTGYDWHELDPMYCEEWTVDGWTDNTDGKLSPSDQLTMTRASDSKTLEFHVEWVSPAPVAGDGTADMFVTQKEIVPEFPLGSVAPIALIAAIAYIWWVTRRKRQEAV